MPIAAETFFATLAQRRWSLGDKRRSGSWSSAWEAIAAADPSLSSARVTVELVFGGDCVVRAATEPVETRSGTTGEVYRYAPLLQSEPEVQSEITIGGGGAASLRAVTLSLDGRLVDPLAIVNGGRMLAGHGEVSIQIDGGDWDDRLVLLRGDMAGGVSFGRSDEILDFEIVDPESTVDLLVPPAVLTAGAFPLARAADHGRRFPLILTDHPAVPLLLINRIGARVYAVGIGSALASGTGATIEVVSIYVDGIEYASTSTVYPWTQGEATDSASGYPLITVESPGSGTGGAIDEDVEVYARVQIAAGSSPDLLGVIRALLTEHSIVGVGGIDYDLFAASETRMPRGLSPKVIINGSGAGDATRAIEYLESTIASDFPMVSFAWSGNGYAPVVADRRRGLYVADLRRAQYPLIDRLSAISESPKADLLNAFTYRYGFDLVNDSRAAVETRDARSSLICRISEEGVGRRDGGVFDSVTVYDAATAAYVVDWLVEHLALPHYVVEYEAFSILALTLRLGDNLYLSDDLLGWERVEATVIGLRYQRGRAVVRFAVWLLFANLPGGARSGSGVTGGGGGGGGGGEGGEGGGNG